jgi:hypothetical protein
MEIDERYIGILLGLFIIFCSAHIIKNPDGYLKVITHGRYRFSPEKIIFTAQTIKRLAIFFCILACIFTLFVAGLIFIKGD